MNRGYVDLTALLLLELAIFLIPKKSQKNLYFKKMKDTLCFRLFAQVELHPSWLVRRWPRCGRRARASPRGISMHFDRGFTPFQIFRYIPSTSFIALPMQQRYLGLGYIPE